MGVLRSFLMLVMRAKLNFLFVCHLSFIDIPVVSLRSVTLGGFSPA